MCIHANTLAETKKAKLIKQIEEINSRLKDKMEVTPYHMKHGHKHFEKLLRQCEKLLRRCEEREKSKSKIHNKMN